MSDNVGYTPGAGTSIATDDVGGVQYQRVKVAHGTDGNATDTSSAAPLPVDTELPAAAALSDSMANPTAPAVGSYGLVFDGTNWQRIHTPVLGGGAGLDVYKALPAAQLVENVGNSRLQITRAATRDGEDITGGWAHDALYNGSNGHDRKRGNTNTATVFDLVARTSSAQSATITNHSSKGLYLRWYIQTPGTGEITLYILAEPGGYSTNIAVLTAPNSTTWLGLNIHPALTPGQLISGQSYNYSSLVPRYWYAGITHSDASSWTYRLDYQYVD